MSEVLKVIVKRVGEDPAEEEVENRLGALQDLVGGYLEAVTIATDMCALVDEEGLLKGRKYNCDVCNYPLFGTIVLVGVVMLVNAAAIFLHNSRLCLINAVLLPVIVIFVIATAAMMEDKK